MCACCYLITGFLAMVLSACLGGDGCNRSQGRSSALSKVPGSVKTSPDVDQPGTLGTSGSAIVPRPSAEPQTGQRPVPRATDNENSLVQ